MLKHKYDNSKIGQAHTHRQTYTNTDIDTNTYRHIQTHANTYTIYTESIKNLLVEYINKKNMNEIIHLIYTTRCYSSYY